MSRFESVAVVGFGTMGRGIAQVLAQAGLAIKVLDAAGPSQIESGLTKIRAFMDVGISRGKLDSTTRDAVLARINPVTQVSDLADCDLVIEAVVEDLETKRALLTELEGVLGDDVPVATNTSALSVTELAATLRSPARMIGVHFFNPAPVMRVVEVIRGLQTPATLAEQLTDFVKDLGKDPVLVRDQPGFLVNHLLMPYLNDVVNEFENGLASASDIDTAVRLGLGHRQGPLELLDLIGPHVHLHATESAYLATLDPQFAPPPLLRRMVSSGQSSFRSTGEDELS